MVHGLWQQTAKGALMIKGSDDIGIQSDSELRMIANSVNTTATFTNTNIKKGGQVVEEIHGIESEVDTSGNTPTLFHVWKRSLRAPPPL